MRKKKNGGFDFSKAAASKRACENISAVRRLFFFCRRAANIVVTILSKVLGYKFDILQMMISFFANIAYDQYCD